MEQVRLKTCDANLLRSVSGAIKNLITTLETPVVPTQFPVSAEIISPTLPYTIVAGTYFSYTIITTGDVSIDGVVVPDGVYSYSTVEDNTLSSKLIDTATTGTAIILLQSV